MAAGFLVIESAADAAPSIVESHAGTKALYSVIRSGDDQTTENRPSLQGENLFFTYRVRPFLVTFIRLHPALIRPFRVRMLFSESIFPEVPGKPLRDGFTGVHRPPNQYKVLYSP